MGDPPFRLLGWKHGTSLDPTRFLSSPMGITQQWSPASRSATSFFRADQEACTIQNSTKRADLTADVNPHWILIIMWVLWTSKTHITHTYTNPPPPVQIPPTQHKTSCCYLFYYREYQWHTKFTR